MAWAGLEEQGGLWPRSGGTRQGDGGDEEEEEGQCAEHLLMT